VDEDVQSCKVMRQMPGQPGQAGRRYGEAGPETASDEAEAGMAQTPKVWRELDEWLHYRSRALQLKHREMGGTIYRELRSRGAMHVVVK